ncbi:FAD-binding oxidoreductase [Pelagovum pacificum]|uniref:FAD-binding oxidoreductase n=1 Tax=Pelagovum pacificum TaxID=2588711 RepID=A0A5C5GD47_9RHOB|nr:FAD-binding oxidoreductase [Pelagovum pacificum]QQA44140.1 FAD-binding oxidoreductase [Pelagovum pacificum]TNY32732.1 FAD-binding oxidoreductase [Pelagovum pacificum]
MLNDADDDFLSRLDLPDAAFRETTEAYLKEPRGRYHGKGRVIAPGSTDEVSRLLRACHEAAVPVVPYSGGTGLVSGQIMESGAKPVILSLERMSEVRALHLTENVLVADAGCILADVQKAAADVDRLFPLSLASEGSARIGGLLGTNAGGVNVLRYGNARAQVLGLEAVLADGTVWNGLGRLRKDNTGYDLKDLLIGSEGTLGIITGASLRLMPRPAVEGAAIFAVHSPQAALDLLALVQGQVAEGVSAFELMHRQGLDFLAESGPEVRTPFAEQPDWMVLIDLGLPAGLSPDEALETLFEAAVEADLAYDGVIARSEAQRQEFWTMRETIPEGNRRTGSISSHDVSIPLSSIPHFIEEGRRRIAKLGDMRINCFGHLGDGNLHYNVFPGPGRKREEYANQQSEVKRTIHDLVHEMEGSISAEHGIGRAKVEDLARYADPTKLSMMRAIKQALDPQGILNPGVILET